MGGIYCCSIDAYGQITVGDFLPLPGVAWLSQGGDHLYALQREPFPQQSGVCVLHKAHDGTLKNTGKTIPCHGSIAAHLLYWADGLYCANYLSGSVAKLPDRLLPLNGSGPVAERQQCSHPHCITLCPDGRTLAVTDLGSDRIWLCSHELSVLGSLQLPPGSGPRHLLFASDGKTAYCTLELSSQVAVLCWENGSLHYVRRYSSLPADYQAWNAVSALRLSADGERLFVSNRGHGSVCMYRTEGQRLVQQGFLCCGDGASLREINIVGQWLICADEAGHKLFAYPLDASHGAAPVCTVEMLRPWCILPF